MKMIPLMMVLFIGIFVSNVNGISATGGESLHQLANDIVMVRPAAFGFNEETAVDNVFQTRGDAKDADAIAARAIVEFDSMVKVLRDRGVNVHVIQDTSSPAKPDAVFPNNWISMHHNGEVVLYPMAASVRRLERRMDVIDNLRQHHRIKRVTDTFVSRYEPKGEYLEGTGSMIFDHMGRSVYACLSPRTHRTVLDDVARHLGYAPVAFECHDDKGVAVYHTNVMMTIGDRFAVIATDSIKDIQQRDAIKGQLRLHGIRQIIEISLQQMAKFAGNILQLATSTADDRFSRSSIVVMSKTAEAAFTDEQRATIEAVGGSIVSFDIPTIEMEGGSVRCMIAEVFLPPLWHDEL